MAAFLPNGIGESLGDVLVTNEPLYMSGDVWYVSSEDGSDAGGTAGQNRAAPLATLGQAHTNASDGDIIVLAADHSETLTSGLTISKDVVIVGAGQSEGKPTAVLKMNDDNESLLSLTGDDIQLRNIYFGPHEKANTLFRVEVGTASSGVGCVIRGCYFEMDENDDAAAVHIHQASLNVIIRSCTFINSSSTGQAEQAITANTGASVVRLEDVVVDGGSQGFSNYYAVDIDATNLQIEGMSLLRGADANLNSSVGYAHIGTATGGARVDW